MAKPIITVSISDSSLKKLGADLSRFASAVKKKIAGDAIYDGADVQLQAAKLLVPVDTGDLRKSLARRRKNFRESVGTVVLARRSKQFPGGYYSHLVEKGHRLFRTTNSGLKVFIKHVPAQPFMRPATEQNREAILRRIKESAAEDIEREFR